MAAAIQYINIYILNRHKHPFLLLHLQRLLPATAIPRNETPKRIILI